MRFVESCWWLLCRYKMSFFFEKISLNELCRSYDDVTSSGDTLWLWLFSLGRSLKVNWNEAVELRSETTGETENCSARSIAGIKHHLCHHDRLVTQYSRFLAVKIQLYKSFCLFTPLHLVFQAKKNVHLDFSTSYDSKVLYEDMPELFLVGAFWETIQFFIF